MTRTMRAGLILLAMFSVFAAAGCGADYATGDIGAEGNYGATPGGAQDIAYFRELVKNGTIPPANALDTEGLLSEHDLSVEGPECEDLMCIRPAVGVAPSLETGEMEYWVQIGMVSGFEKGEFRRPPLDLVILIDKSSSMSIDMTETNQAAVNMIENLRDDDRVAVVAFDSTTHVLQQPDSLANIDRADLVSRIKKVEAKGSSNMLLGLERAYQFAQGFESGRERMARVVLLSCGYPDARAEGEKSFRGIVKDGASAGIGLTFVGVLLGHHHEVAEALSQERGGNYYYFNDLPRMEQIFLDEFDFLVTPLAYDLQFELKIDEDHYAIDKLYGLPGDDEGAPRAAFDVKTAFISKRKGAMLARLRATGDETPKHVAQVDFSYVPEAAHGWTEASEQSAAVVSTSDTESSYFDSQGVRKAVALVNMADVIKASITLHGDGDQAEAVSKLETLRNYLEKEADALDDDALRAELELIDALIALMKA